MDKKNNCNELLSIAGALVDFCYGGSGTQRGHVREFAFGITESVIVMRSFYDPDPEDNFDSCMDALASKCLQPGVTKLFAKVCLRGKVYFNQYSPDDGKQSKIITDDSFPNGAFFRVERVGQSDELFSDRKAFREYLGPRIRELLQSESSHPNVFFNAESCDFD